MRLLLPFALAASAAFAQPPTYDDAVRPIFARRCFTCHGSGESRNGLSLETYAGVLKGGASGDAVQPGRPAASLLYQAILQEKDGVVRMPLGQPRLPDAEIAVIRGWIEQGLRENARSRPKGPVTQSLDFKPTTLNKPDAPAMPDPPLWVPSVPEPARPHPITALAASPWAPLAAAAGHERIYLYDLNRRALLETLPFPEGIPYVLRFSRDGSVLVAGGGRGVQSGKLVLYDVRTGARKAVLGDERDIVLAADLSPDGKLVALGGPGRVVRVYSTADSKLAYELKRHNDWITALQFSPDGARLATADRSGGIFLWEAGAGGLLVSLAEHKDSVTALDWRPDGLVLASASEDGQIILWNALDGFPAATIGKAHGAGQGVMSVAFLPDGRLVSAGRDRTLRTWSSAGKPGGASPPRPSLLTKVAAGWDGTLALAGDYAGEVLVWDHGKWSNPLPRISR